MNGNDPVLRSLELIESRISEKLTVESIAESIYFSKFHYGRLFREAVGDNVMEYVTKRKLTLAGRALLETDATILEIALRFGYDSHEGFTRGFKAYMGVTPSEYRKYGLAAISQNTVKEKRTMLYSKTTDEVIRELNGLIVKTKDWAASVRAIKPVNPNIENTWRTWADDSDLRAERLKSVLERVSSIADNPDEITNRFTIIKAIDDFAFQANIKTFNMTLCMVGREREESAAQNAPYCERYREIARDSANAGKKISKFLDELAKLIIEDMRKTAEEKINAAVQAGKDANDSIVDYSIYIKDELGHLIEALSSTPIGDVTESLLESTIFQLNYIKMAAEVDVFRWPDSKSMFAGLDVFLEKLEDAADFCKAIVKPKAEGPKKDASLWMLESIASQGSILLFFYRSETEKMGRFSERIPVPYKPILNDEKKAAMDEIEDKFNAFLSIAKKADINTSFDSIAKIIREIIADMDALIEVLGVHGGALKIINGELRHFAEKISNAGREAAVLPPG